MSNFADSLSPDFFDFINTNIDKDANALRLKKFSNVDFDVKFAITQIECLQRIRKKLPEIYDSHKFLFASTLNTEQCTSETLAKYHASLIAPNSKILDMTAGICVDAYYISQKASHLTALEINADTAEVDKINMSNNCDNVTVINGDSVEYIKQTDEHFDTVFIDPARRGDNNKRMFGFQDCEPNLIELLPRLQDICDNLMVKASSMIDITQSLNSLPYVSDVWVLGVRNECKELLFRLDFVNKPSSMAATVHAVNFTTTNEVQHLSYPFESITGNATAQYGTPNIGDYIYEPNSCIMKANLFPALLENYKVTKIAQHTHIFFSTEKQEDFPGRSFIVTDIIPFKDKAIKDIKKNYPQINVSTRNFKLTPELLKKKLNVKDGGNSYLFGITTSSNEQLLIICKK